MLRTLIDDLMSELENGTNITSLNGRITEVNTEESGDAPAITKFWGLDREEGWIDSDLPLLYCRAASVRREPEYSGQADTIPTLEFGLVLAELHVRDWIDQAAVVVEALARCLDEVRGLHDIGEIEEPLNCEISGWSAPGATEPAWGGFIGTVSLRKAVNV